VKSCDAILKSLEILCASVVVNETILITETHTPANIWKLVSLSFAQLQKFRDELKNRSRVLKMLGHINAEGVVQLKGRAACLIDTGDELLVTELMFNGAIISHILTVLLNEFAVIVVTILFTGTFNDLDHHQVAALASCFIPGDKSNEQIHLRNELAKPLQQLQDSARRIAEV